MIHHIMVGFIVLLVVSIAMEGKSKRDFAKWAAKRERESGRDYWKRQEREQDLKDSGFYNY